MQATFNRACFMAAVLSVSISVPLASSQTASHSPGETVSRGTIACRVIELKTAPTVGAIVVVFHRAENADRDSIGAFLRNHDGARVELDAGNGNWQAASVFRLKSCFGRGLLVLPAGQARLAEGDKFLLRAGAASGN